MSRNGVVLSTHWCMHAVLIGVLAIKWRGHETEQRGKRHAHNEKKGGRLLCQDIPMSRSGVVFLAHWNAHAVLIGGFGVKGERH